MKTVKLEEFNEKAFSEAKIDKALLAFGSTESHGGHLPYGCDTFVSYTIALETAERLENTVVVPPMWYGMSHHYRHKPMAVSLSSETLIRVIEEVFDSLVRWGIKKILVINGHDGNLQSIQIAARNAKIKYPDMGLAVLEAWWETAGRLLPADTFEVWNGLGHGGEGETSIGLSMFPELCDMKEARGMIPDMDPNVNLIWNFQELTDYGASGAPEKGSREKGDKMRKVLVDYLVAFVNRMDAENWHYKTR